MKAYVAFLFVALFVGVAVVSRAHGGPPVPVAVACPPCPPCTADLAVQEAARAAMKAIEAAEKK